MYIPLILDAFKNIEGKVFLDLNYSLDYFFKKCNEVLQKAFNENKIDIINEIIKLNKSEIIFQDIYSLMINIFHLPKSKLIKKPDKNIEVNFSSLLSNSFNFFSFFVNEYFLENNILPSFVEADLIYLIMKYPTLYFRKYLAKVINKIYIEHVLINIYKNLLTDEFNNLKYKSLFFIVRLLLMNGMFNYLDFFAKFLKKNISFELNSPNEIIEYFVSHLSFQVLMLLLLYISYI